jgi:chloramphenicol O-acetyltransferase type A
MKTPIDLTTWPRREHFEFFRQYDMPFFGVTDQLDCTRLYDKAKSEGFPFSVGYHFASLQAANEIEELRCRIEDDLPVRYDAIHFSTTVARPDGTFGFSFQKFTVDFGQFATEFMAEVRRVQSETGLKSPYSGQDIIYYTVARGIAFTSFDHPMMFKRQGSIPLMAFGEMVCNGTRKAIAHALHASHALVDGQHAAKYFKRVQQLLENV